MKPYSTRSSIDSSAHLSLETVSSAISALHKSDESIEKLPDGCPSAKSRHLDRDHHHLDTHPPAEPHVHSEDSRKRIINRLSRIEGHLRGIKTMVKDDRPCPDVLIQIAAVRGGLDRVARIILDEHLSECITRAVDEGNIEAEVAALKAALDRFI